MVDSKHNINSSLKEGGLNTRGIFKKGLKNQPLVSVITSVFNGGNKLEEAILSVINQTYPFVEYIIIDGGSTDDTLTILNKYSDSIDYWKSEPDNGIYSAWNKGLSIAKGQWISFLGADDTLKQKAIEDLISVSFKSSSKLDYISGKTELVKDGRFLKITGEPWDWKKFKKYVSTGHNGALHSINLYEKVGNYDTSFKSSGDYELLLRLGKNLKTGYVDKVTSSMNLGGISNNSTIAFWESYRAKLINGATSKFFGLIYAIFSIVKWKLVMIIKN